MFRRKPPQPERPISSLSHQLYLTPGVLFALQYREAQLGRKEIRPLFRTDIANLGFYLVMKATDNHDGLQTELIQAAYASSFRFHDMPLGLIDQALDHLDGQDPPTVKGAKLAEVSRTGFDTWRQNYREALDISVGADAELFMIANSTYIGFAELAAHSLARGRQLGVLKPSRLDTTDQSVGFMLRATDSGLAVSPLAADFARPANAVLFDDVVRHGATMIQALDFWQADGSPRPHYVATKVVPENPTGF